MLRIKVGNKMVGLKQLSPNDIGSLRRTKSSEMSTFVQCNNHAHSIHNKKKVDLWYKEQNINVGKLGRGQQVMYKQLLKVHSEKRRNRKKKYIQQQELVRQQLREKAARERHKTALELNRLGEGMSDLPEVLSDIGEEEELNIEGDAQEKEKKATEATAGETGGQVVNDADRPEEKKDAEKGTVQLLKTPIEKRGKPKKSKRKIGTVSFPGEVPKSESGKKDEGDSEATETEDKSTENRDIDRNEPHSREEGSQQQDDAIDLVSGVNRDLVKTNLDRSDSQRREKRVQEPVGLLPRVSLTTSYLTHGAPRESDEDASGHTQTEKSNGKTRRISRRRRSEHVQEGRSSVDKAPEIVSQEAPRISVDRLPELVSRRSSEAPNRKDSLNSSGRKSKTEKMVNIANFHNFTRSVRIPSNVYIPRVSRVVRYHRNTKGSLVPDEVSLKPVEEDYKLPSTKETYFIKKALEREKEKAIENEKRLQSFYSKMEQVPSRVSVMARPIPSPTKDIFVGEQKKLDFSASLLTHMRHTTTIEGDVHDLRNCKYIRFHDIASPEQRELLRRRRLSSWGKHETADKISWRANESRKGLNRVNATTY